MSREEHDREDLLAEATALSERVSLRVDALSPEVIVGFRDNGSASFFFGAEPVYQFNSSGQLRRAYVEGLPYKAERGRLISLSRKRTPRSVELVRHQLTPAETAAFLAAMHEQLAGVRAALAANQFELVGQVPIGSDVAGRALGWLSTFGQSAEIADSPRAI